MAEINIISTSVSSITDYDLHMLKRYQEKSGDYEDKRTHRNWCRFCYRYGRLILSGFYCGVCSVCVCVLMNQ